MASDTVSSRQRSTLIYFLLTAVTLLGGVAVTLWGTSMKPDGIAVSDVLVAVGTSMLAGGVAGTALGVLRYLDDRDDEATGREVEGVRADVASLGRLVSNEAVKTRRDLGRSVRISNSAQTRCLSDAQVGSEFRRTFLRALDTGVTTRPGEIKVDVAGLKLHRFLEDQLDWLVARGAKAEVRLLLQNPASPVFDQICRLEGRSVTATTEDVAETLNTLNTLPVNEVSDRSLVAQRDGLTLRLRFFDDYQPITMFRVDDFCCTRPRVSTPRGAATRFYETYDRSDSDLHFSVYSSHFDRCWNQASFSVPSQVVELLSPDFESRFGFQ